MDAKQREMARHALGLPNKSRTTYRNRFVTDEAGDDFEVWMGMVARHWAKVRGPVKDLGGMYMFWLTRTGAAAALEPGETLNPKDFPVKGWKIVPRDGFDFDVVPIDPALHPKHEPHYPTRAEALAACLDGLKVQRDQLGRAISSARRRLRRCAA